MSVEFLMNYTAIWFLWLEFSKKSWSRRLRLLFQNDTINLYLPKILFNLLLFDDTKDDTTSKSMRFKTIRMTRIIRTTFSNVDNPLQNLTTGFSLRESNLRKLIQKTKILKIVFFFSKRWNISKSLTLLIVQLLSVNQFHTLKKNVQNIYFYTGVHCTTVRQKDNLGHSIMFKLPKYVIFIWLNIFQESFLFII